MVVHRIQIMSSTDVNSENVRVKVSDLKSSYGEKLSKENAPFDQGQSMDGSISFYRGTFIVTMDESNKDAEKNDLLEQIRKEMDKSASWWQTRYHRCEHDEQNPSGCSWNEVVKSDSSVIPDEVEY